MPDVSELESSVVLEDRQMVMLQCASEENCLSSSSLQIDRSGYGKSTPLADNQTTMTAQRTGLQSRAGERVKAKTSEGRHAAVHCFLLQAVSV